MKKTNTEKKFVNMFGTELGGSLINIFDEVRKDAELKKNSRKTYIASDGKYFKIGRSIDPAKRIKSLQIASPNLFLVHVIQTDIEKKLHSKFLDKKIGNEWFNLNEDDLFYLKSL
ncbi:GIY-YIG nuclease family protein [Sphingobacterium sp.]|uniref:GIY-YIG nuclease family protein n=1 Tax=Sphingobacterium sp. TaxID=341027 RepID=UPI002FD9518E